MPEYQVVFARSARKELQTLEARLARRILARIAALTANPRPAGCEKLQGSGSLWRIRISAWCVVYRIDDKTHLVDIAAFRHRRDVYR